MEEVACPGCGQEKFPAVACSECYCSCGTAFRIAENGVPIRVARQAAREKVPGTGLVRRALPEDHRTCLYRIVQESLTNCVRHSQAKHVTVELGPGGEPDAVFLTVRDDGIGFAPSDSVGKGLGLVGMEERVRELGGSMMIQSVPGTGTTLRVRLPFRSETSEKTESVAG